MDTRDEYSQTVSYFHFHFIFTIIKRLTIDYFSLFFSDANNVKRLCNNFNFVDFLLNLIPVLKWLPKYSIKNNLAGDVSAGITVAVMHIPQGIYTRFTCDCVFK